jgi:hypothetical protein
MRAIAAPGKLRYERLMNTHGHAKADYRNLELHRTALGKLKSNPELLPAVLALLRRWLDDETLRPSWPHLRRWREALTEWPIERLEALVLDPEEGQVLRQCSPLGPVLTPRERSVAFMEAERKARELKKAS